ncbi:hypothetical protein EDD85DRAFT_790867 [Armillaria nabsnona]|nr:hypothetical protein EDD85DRAFT_790867 [Armillaria nabsnona]
MPHLRSHIIVLVVFLRNSGRLENPGQPTYGSRVQWQTQPAFVHVTIKVLVITWIQILPDGYGIYPVAAFTLAKWDLILAGIIYAFECGSLCEQKWQYLTKTEEA